MNHELLAHDYRSSMQRAALAYLQKHEAQFLVADSDLLYDNCVRHLTTALEVPVFMAERLVHNAWAELQASKRLTWIGVDLAAGLSWSPLHPGNAPDLHAPPTDPYQVLLTALSDSAHKHHPQ
ncbi:hypothetical protein TRE132_14460 [Pseudomonas chlororaphis subsp. aurantiaca]|nr:hypothetical protein TRE132_14460 [Pseudomonas chlororaphis subsp. aurantiaca]